MKNRSELREIVMKVLYQVFILNESGIEFDVNSSESISTYFIVSIEFTSLN